MRERILEFLKRENKSSVHFAEEIGVQPSGVSHILSGRNKPSLDFVLKMLEKYKFLSTDWLLFGKGSMYKEQKIPTLFDDLEDFNSGAVGGSEQESQAVSPPPNLTGSGTDPGAKPEINPSGIKKIIWFYENNSFEEFSPGKG
ncbi:MAG: helix-turn-helix transcriptional regulator [Bacteroidales bacterium]